ncbi:MAG: T9SS type A sorting domain-containing protein [Bacteroidota bacterium]
MKRTLLIFLSGFVLACTIYSQDLYFFPNFDYVRIDENWDDSTSSWIPKTRMSFERDAFGRELERVTESFRSRAWQKTWRVIRTYHDFTDNVATYRDTSFRSFDSTKRIEIRVNASRPDGRPLSFDLSSYELTEAGFPFDSSRLAGTYTYDDQGRLMQYEELREDIFNQQAIIFIERRQSYVDGEGCRYLTEITRGSPDNFDVVERITYEPNGDCQPTEEVQTVSLVANPTPSTRITYSYNRKGQLEERVRFVWDEPTDQWKELKREAVTYIGDTVRTKGYEWNEDLQNWETDYSTWTDTLNGVEILSLDVNWEVGFLEGIAFDSKGRLVRLWRQVRNAADEWEDFYAEEKEYDALGRLTRSDRLVLYEPDLGVYRGLSLIQYTYIEDEVLREVKVETTFRTWVDSLGEYQDRIFAIRDIYDYYCDEVLQTAVRYENGVQTSRVRILVDTTDQSICNPELFEEFLVYPNPVEDFILIKPDPLSRVPIEVEIFDLQGRRLRDFTTRDKAFITQVDVSNFRAGTYVIRLRINEEIRVQKFTKIKD